MALVSLLLAALAAGLAAGGTAEEAGGAAAADDAALLAAVVADRKAPPTQRLFALEQLAALDGWIDPDSLTSIKSRARGPWEADYVRCLGRTGLEGLRPLERYLRKRNDGFTRAEAAYALGRCDLVSLHTQRLLREGLSLPDAARLAGRIAAAAGEPLGARFGDHFARELLHDPDASEMMKVAAFCALEDRGSPFARIEALRRLPTGEGAVLIKSIHVLRDDPHVEDAPFLVDLIQRVQGRPMNEAVRLLQQLTNYQVGRDPKAWRYWMLKHRAEGTPFRRPTDEDEEEPTTISYMGIPILGEKIIFVLDSSGSMDDRLPERSRTKGAEAVEELVRLLPRLPLESVFNLVFFHSGVVLFESRMVPRNAQNLEAAVDWLRANRFEGATNLYGGLKAALDRAEVEEIIVLSDGEPTAGELTDPDRIRARVACWNRFRLVRINTISFGAPPAARNFLYHLARENDGICRVIN